MSDFLNARKWLKNLIRGIIRPRPKSRIWQWLDRHVRIPESSGGPKPGRLRTANFPIFRGIYDLAQKRGVHFITLCSSARAGKTLFCICMVLYWVAEKFGAIVWLDPTRSSARKFVKDELDEFLLECKPVQRLAIAPPGTPGAKTFWTLLEKAFRGKRMRIVGSGAEADLHGFNAELAIINELDRCRESTRADASSADKIIARTRLFASSRLVIRNSTPGDKGEFSPIWQHFLRGSQHYCYVPCPHCTVDRTALNSFAPFSPPPDPQPGRSLLSYDPRLAGWQRLSFFKDKKLVPFDVDLNPVPSDIPREKWREEVTGCINFEKFAIYEDRPRLDDPTQTERVRVDWDLDAVESGATYACAHCGRDIENVDLSWMLARYWWVAHNPGAKSSDISAHVWAAYSPFESWGVIATEFLQAKGNLGMLIKVWNLTFGLPFIREGTAVKESDLDRVIARTPIRYVQGQLPLEPEILTMTIDVQGEQFWYVIRATGILWDAPEWPTWSALIDWGEAVSWEQLLELAGLRQDSQGYTRRFKFGDREYMVTAGLADSGFEAKENKKVYEFCLANSAVFSPCKGGDQSKTRGNTIRLSPIMDDQLDLVWLWSDYFAADLYYTCIKDGSTVAGPVHWWLPVNIDKHYRKHLTSERQVEENGRRVWRPFDENHLGDCEKYQRGMSGTIEERLDEIRAIRAAEEKEKKEKRVSS